MIEQRSPAQREKIRILEAQRQVLLAKRAVIDEEIKSVERQIRETKRQMSEAKQVGPHWWCWAENRRPKVKPPSDLIAKPCPGTWWGGFFCPSFNCALDAGHDGAHRVGNVTWG